MGVLTADTITTSFICQYFKCVKVTNVPGHTPREVSSRTGKNLLFGEIKKFWGKGTGSGFKSSLLTLYFLFLMA